jgi:hypothetical protein
LQNHKEGKNPSITITNSANHDKEAKQLTSFWGYTSGEILQR